MSRLPRGVEETPVRARPKPHQAASARDRKRCGCHGFADGSGLSAACDAAVNRSALGALVGAALVVGLSFSFELCWRAR
jgi:hypothetical protein